MKPVLLLALPASAAEQLSVHVLEGGGLGALDAELARELTALTVKPSSGVARRCEEEVCLRSLLTEAQAEQGLFLRVTSMRRGSWDVEVAWLDGTQAGVTRRRVPSVAVAELKGPLRPAVAALVPPFARKGWGGLVVDADAARLRVDGRILAASGAVTPVLAGPHEVNLLLTPPTEASPLALGTSARGKGLRAASYVTFSLGALAVAGSLVAGGLSRGARDGIRPCGAGADRSCTPFSEARAAHDKSERYARTGNVLLGVGGALSTVGVGLFIFDIAVEPGLHG